MLYFHIWRKGQNDICVMCYLKLLLVEESQFENQVRVSYSSPIEPNSYLHSLKPQLIKWRASEFPSQLKVALQLTVLIGNVLYHKFQVNTSINNFLREKKEWSEKTPKFFTWWLKGINWTEPELGNYQFCQTWTAADLDVVLSFLYDPPKDLCCFGW
jgi:hypothetical protein